MDDRQLNVLFLTVDTLRADHLGCYGYHRQTSPNIDKLASQGTLVERFLCPVIPTQPSYTTMYTGQHPINHRVIAHGGDQRLDKNAPFLPELFLGEDYTTCAIDNLLQERDWFARGYEFYINPGIRRPLFLGVTGEELNRRAIPWLRTHADEPFFLMMHYWDPHWPLEPPAKFQNLFYNGNNNPTDPGNHSLDDFWKHPLGQLARDTWLRRREGPITDATYVEALYDREICHLDEVVGELLNTLDELGLAENTLVMLVGDHGESMTEHGIYFEHHGLYETTIRVPMIVRLPGVVPEGVRLPQIFQHHDIAPTLLEAADLEVPDEIDGISFWGHLTGEAEDGGRGYAVSVENTWQAKWSITTNRHKFILARKPDFYGTPMRELYDIDVDPREDRNIFEDQPEIAAQLEAQLEEWISKRLEELGMDQDPLLTQEIGMGKQYWSA